MESAKKIETEKELLRQISVLQDKARLAHKLEEEEKMKDEERKAKRAKLKELLDKAKRKRELLPYQKKAT